MKYIQFYTKVFTPLFVFILWFVSPYLVIVVLLQMKSYCLLMYISIMTSTVLLCGGCQSSIPVMVSQGPNWSSRLPSYRIQSLGIHLLQGFAPVINSADVLSPTYLEDAMILPVSLTNMRPTHDQSRCYCTHNVISRP